MGHPGRQWYEALANMLYHRCAYPVVLWRCVCCSSVHWFTAIDVSTLMYEVCITHQHTCKLAEDGLRIDQLLKLLSLMART